MSEKKKAVVLIGSPRKKGNSIRLSGYFIEQLRTKDGDVEWESEVYRLYAWLISQDRLEQLIQAMQKADLIVLASPLYYDSLPAVATYALEVIRDHWKQRKVEKSQQFMTIINSGFPEASQSEVAVDICRLFAGEVGLEWLGGLALGAGDMPRGSVQASLELAAESVSRGKPIPEEAIDLIARPFAPAFMYLVMGNSGWWFQAREKGAHRKIRDRPYEK